MIARNPEQQTLYNARLKFQRDEAARLEFAKEQGRVEGEQIGQIRGEQIGQIRVYEEILGLRQSPVDELTKMNADEMAAKVADLRRQLRTRKV